MRHFQRPTCPPPTGDRLHWTSPAGPGRGGAKPAAARPKTVVNSHAVAHPAVRCRPPAFRVRSRDVRLGAAAITLCRHGRLFRPATCSHAFTRRDRTDAGGPSAVSRDGISPRPPRELRIGRSLWAGLLGAQSARDQDGPSRPQGRRLHRSSTRLRLRQFAARVGPAPTGIDVEECDALKRRWVGVGEIPDGDRWDSPPKIRFAPDSPPEGDGFELLVPSSLVSSKARCFRAFQTNQGVGCLSSQERALSPCPEDTIEEGRRRK